MSAVTNTKHGAITVSKKYFSFILCREVFQLTLIKPENEENGYGVSKEFNADTPISRELFEQFAEEASSLL